MSKSNALTTVFVVFLILVLMTVGLLSDYIFKYVEQVIYPEDYYDLVVKYSEEYSIPTALTFAVIKTESNFDKNVISSAGAMGLMQIMPSTYEWLAQSKFNESADVSLLYNPEVNIRYGTYYLQYLYAKFGTWEKALIAYNWGEGNFKKFLDEYGYTEGDYDSIPVKETRNYVKKVLHHWEKYEKLYENI